MGWGLVLGEGNRMRHVAHGVIRVAETLPLAQRLVHIEEGLKALIAEHKPHAGSVETLFFHKDPQAAAKLGHARGVVLLCLQRDAVAVHEYAPARVKSALTGQGRAQKLQVAHMVKMLLCLDELPPADAADALALAITHLRRAPIAAQVESRVTGNPALAALLRPRKRKPLASAALIAALRR
jgi:crossover junction endodeoxyribonuclease RuvC